MTKRFHLGDAELVGVDLTSFGRPRKGELKIHFADKSMRQVDVAARFGENLVRCRKRAGLSQEELGFRASLHRTEIGMLERGIRLARIDTLIKLAGAIGVEPAELLDGLFWRPADPRVGEFGLRRDEADEV